MSAASILTLRAGAVPALVVMALATAYFALRPDLVLGDPDIWWHIHIGRDIIAKGAVPYVDSYSYTFSGAPWIAKEWLSQVALGAIFNVTGWNGVMGLSVLAIATALALFFAEIHRHLATWQAALAVVAAAIALTTVTVARPHVLTLAPMVLLTIHLFRASGRGETPCWWLLAVIALWANLHGSFTLALVIAGFAFLDMLEVTRLRDRRVIAKWIIFGLLAGLATLATPYGWGLYSINFSMMAGNETMPLITEWQPFSAQRDRLMEVGLIAMVGGFLALRPRLGWARILFILFTLHMFLLHVRFVYVFILLAPLVAAMSLPPRVVASLTDAKRTSTTLAAGTIAIVLAFGILATSKPFAPPERRVLAEAFAFIRSQNLPGPPVNGYNLGGVVMFNGFKTFLDGRTEQLFRGAFMEDYLAAGQPDGQEAMSRMLATSKAQWTIFTKRDQRNSFVAATHGWSKVYEDDFVIIHRRDALQ